MRLVTTHFIMSSFSLLDNALSSHNQRHVHVHRNTNVHATYPCPYDMGHANVQMNHAHLHIHRHVHAHISQTCKSQHCMNFKMKNAIFYLKPNMTHVQYQRSHSAGLKLQKKVPNLVSGSVCGTARAVATRTCPSARQCTSCPSCSNGKQTVGRSLLCPTIFRG